MASRTIFDLDCNWKIAMEANTKVYSDQWLFKH